MILVLESNLSEEQIAKLRELVIGNGVDVKEIVGKDVSVLGLVGDTHRIDAKHLESLPGVERVIKIQQPYKLVNRAFHPENSIVQVGEHKIGGKELAIIAGPCSVESEQQLMTIGSIVKEGGAHMLRGGAYKPRTSPYGFQGLKEDGLKLLQQAKREFGKPTVTEVISPETVELVAEYTDLLQIGARNMQNFELLKRVGKVNRPVLLKRGPSATIEELLLAAEYIMAEGNENVILCERGIRTYEKYTRNTLDLSAIPVIKELSHLPVIVDPSHAAGNRDWVIPLVTAAIAAGADGIIVEVHHQPEVALSDGPQSLTPPLFTEMMARAKKIAAAVDRIL